MKRSLLIVLFFVAGRAWAGFHFGLGTAVAKEGAKALDKAAAIDLTQATGDNAAAALPLCGSDPSFTVAPVVLTDVAAIDPLGHMNGPGHTLPSDHIYFYFNPVSSSTPFGARVSSPLRAPGDARVTEVASTEYLSAPTPFIDYAIYFYSCREQKAYFGHVVSLDSAFLAKVGPMTDSCFTYGTGGAMFRRCDKPVNVSVVAGEPLGTAGGATTAALDFGMYDFRQTPLAFTSPSRHYGDQAYTVCPASYFTPGLQAQLNPMFGRFDGGFQRSVAPVCGAILYDVANTAQGDWYKVGAPDSPEDPHLALVYDNVYADKQALSVGSGMPGVSPGPRTFVPLNSGTANRNFSQVSADGNVYCYDSFFDPLGQPAFSSASFRIKMPTATTLQIEYDAVSPCGSGPWTLSSNAVDYQR